ncbi:hypothetical protein JTE90_004088 [Oedothorax gibbosus]|uniref:Uncharacterized protein n=1 Tax=Oedothorax gibbosus TaxID=931172 RepID=A0AAV6UD65_9ARAC|nr:hypothetical protein JTE90_004088 [Oedothorax gibbosus]
MDLRKIHLHGELYRILIPLIQKCIKECPQDLTTFCSEYFQSLLNARNNTDSPENRESTSSDERIMSSCEDSNKPAVQGSSSLPILNKEEPGAQLRETTSWNESSRSRQTPAQSKKVHFSTIKQEIQTGDYLNEAVESTDKYNNYFGEIDQPKDGEVLPSIAEKNGSQCENNDTSTKKFDAQLCPSSKSVSQPISEFEEEFEYLVNSALCSMSKSTAGIRKKWKSEADAYWQLESKFKRPDEQVESEDEAYPHTVKRQEPFGGVVTTSASEESQNVEFGFSPILRNATEREKRLEKSVLRVLKELKEMIHTLCAFRLEFDDQLHEIIQARDGGDRTEIVVRPPTPPRKKHPESRPENSESGSLSSKDEHDSRLDKHDLAEDIHGKSEKMTTSTECIEVKSVRNIQSEEHLEQKESRDSELTQDNSKLSEELFVKKSDEAIHPVEPEVPNDNCALDVQSKTENSEWKETKTENRHSDLQTESQMTDDFKSEMMYSKLEETHRENSKNRHPDKRLKCQEFQNSPQLPPRHTKYSNTSNTFSVPTETKSQRQGWKNRSPNHRGFRRGHSNWWTWQRPSSSNFLGGGDVLQATTNTQHSVATDTFSLGITVRPRNSNDGRRMEAHISPFNGRLVSDNSNRERKRAFEKELVRNETIKKTSASKRTGGSKSPQKYRKGVDRSLKPNDMPSKPIEKSEVTPASPIKNSVKHETKPIPLQQNSEKFEPKFDPQLHNSKKQEPNPVPPLQYSKKEEPKSDLQMQTSRKHEIKPDSGLQNFLKDKHKSDSSVQSSGKLELKSDPLLQTPKKQQHKSDFPLQISGKHGPKSDSPLPNSKKDGPKNDAQLQNSDKHDTSIGPPLPNSKKEEPKYQSPLTNSGKHERESNPPLPNTGKYEPKNGSSLRKSGKHEPKCTENVEQGNDGSEIRRAISNSSLNPSAKSFQPSNFKAKEKLELPVKYQKSPTAPIRERRISEDTEDQSQRKNSDLSRNSGFTIDWATENPESSAHLEDRRKLAPHRENCCSGSKKNGASHGFTSTPKPQRETSIPYVRLNNTNHQPKKENGFKRRTNTFRNDQKTANGKNSTTAAYEETYLIKNGAAHCMEENQRQCSPRQEQQHGLSLASGDLVVSGDGDRSQLLRQENVNQHSNVPMNAPGLENSQGPRNPIVGPQVGPQKEEPGLSSAGGDFVVAADGGRNQLPPVQQERVMNVLREEMRPAATNLPNQDFCVSIPEAGNRNARGMEEIEFDFTCGSESEESELDSSEMSEEYQYD